MDAPALLAALLAAAAALVATTPATIPAAPPAAAPPAGTPAAQLPPTAPTGQPAAPALPPTPTPAAIIEHSASDTIVERDGSFVATRSLVVRVAREEAIRGVATVPIPVSTSLQRFELIEAWTELPDGRRLDVKPESVITQAPPYAAQLQTLSDMQLKVVNFPGVVVGAKLHLTTRIAQATPYFPGVYFTETWATPATVVLDGAVRVSLPRDMPLHVEVAGMAADAPAAQGDRRIYAWHYRQTDYRPPGGATLSPLDGPTRLIATTLDGWPALADAYQRRATERERPSPRIKALADQLTRGQGSERAKAAALAGWVQRNIRYVNIVLGTGGFVPAAADEVLETRYGDCKGHATILNALLAAAGIRSTAVLINAGPTYRQPAVAGQVFNHMINYLPGLDTFVDTTSPFTSFGDLPPADRAKFVVLTRSGTARRTPEAGPEPEGVTTEVAMTVLPDGGIDGTSRIIPTGAFRASLRAMALGARGADPKAVAAALMRSTGTPGTGTVAFPDPAAPDAQAALVANWHLDDAVTASGTGALRPPYGVAIDSIAALAAGGSGPLPTAPVPCTPVSLRETLAIRFPPGTAILSLPRDAAVETPEISYAASWRRDGEVVTIARRYAARYPGRVCAPEVAARVQAAKRQIARDTGAQIVYARGG